MEPKNFIQLEDGNGNTIVRFGVGLWPVPERIWLVYPLIEENHEVGLKLATPCVGDEVDTFYDYWGRHPEVEPCVTEFQRVTMSEMSDELASSPHLARGAQYEPVT